MNKFDVSIILILFITIAILVIIKLKKNHMNNIDDQINSILNINIPISPNISENIDETFISLNIKKESHNNIINDINKEKIINSDKKSNSDNCKNIISNGFESNTKNPKQIIRNKNSCDLQNKFTDGHFYKTFLAETIPLEDYAVRGSNYMEYTDFVQPTKLNVRLLSQNTKGLPPREIEYKNIPTSNGYAFNNTPAMRMD